MAEYSIRFKTSPQKQLQNIPVRDAVKIVDRIKRLAQQPRPPDSSKLAGGERYRIRQGDYRAIYSVDDSAKIVMVVKIAHRREVYRE